MIPVYKPYLPEKSLKYAHLAIKSGWLSHGEYNEKTIDKLKELLNVPYVLLTSNGTAATYLVSRALKFKYPEIKKIIVPNNVFIAAINSFLYDKDFELHTVDADLDTWNYDLNLLDEKIKEFDEKIAVLIVHNIGNIINVPELQKKYPDVIFVEDNCEGFLGKYGEKYSGTESLCSSFSGYGNKTVTAGEFGAFITKDEEIYNYIKCYYGQGQSSNSLERFIHPILGNNFRLCHVSAAIMYGQLEILPEILIKKKKIFDLYRNSEFNHQKQLENTEHSNWMFGIKLNKKMNYSMIESYFKNNNIEIRPMFYELSKHKFINNNNLIKLNNEKNAKILNEQCFILPSYPELNEKSQEFIIKTCKGIND